MAAKKITGVVDMQVLADLAGVSRSTVSRALRNSPLVNSATRQLIQNLAREHHYVPNEAARNFRLRRTNIVSVVPGLDIAVAQQLSDPFFLEMVGYIADALAAHNFDLLLQHAPIATAGEFVASRTYRQSEGIIFLGQGQFNEELNRLAGGSVPFIVWGGKVPVREYPLVGSDNYQGGYLATRHLLDQGCRKIAFFGNVIHVEFALRHEGYSQALAEAGLAPAPALYLPVPVEAAQAQLLIDDLLDRRPDMDAVLCCSDLLAMSAISCLQNRGLRVPADIPVVGYDNLCIAPRTNPPLTTIDQKMRQQAQRLVSGILEMINGRQVDDAVTPAELIVRSSTRS